MANKEEDRKSDAAAAAVKQEKTGQKLKFIDVSTAQDGAKHSLGITDSGTVYSWGPSNHLGQLGRKTNDSKRSSKIKPQPVEYLNDDSSSEIKAVRVYTGGLSDSGHSAILDLHGNLHLAGCDRWQQLGLGSSAGGAAGYTWENGQLWRERFVRNDFLKELMNKHNNAIRDVAFGGDHTVVLSSNKRDVYTFGKGGEGQLGLKTKPFVSSPQRSTVLSSSLTDSVAAVCAIRHCSLTLDDRGNVLNQAGKCKIGASSGDMADALKACIQRAERDGLLKRTS